MDNQALQDCGQMEDDEFPEEFQCCVCLDIMYKPVVLACGHISCFWCVFNAMDTSHESHCPVCRKPYNHFPRICELMHFLLLMLYPSPYKSKEKQVAEEEKRYGHTSPQFNNMLIDSEHSSPPLPEAVPNKSNATFQGDHSFDEDSSKRTFLEKDIITNTPTTSSSPEANCVAGHSKQDLLTLLQCAICKQLLCRPVVLNCGHVYCEACNSPQDNVCKCPKCQSAHPNGFPNVCLVLEHFLEMHFREEYSARKESLSNLQNANPSQGLTGKQEQAAQPSPVPKYVYSSLFSGHGPKFHRGVGCDYCGMCPIIGERYRCKDCVEKIGFDLCENCYNTSSKLPGRFNQQHTQDHKFEVIQPHSFGNIILSLRADHSEGDEIHVVDSDSGVILTGSYLSNDVSDDDLEIISSVNTLDSDSQDVEDSIVSPDSPEDQHRNSAA